MPFRFISLFLLLIAGSNNAIANIGYKDLVIGSPLKLVDENCVPTGGGTLEWKCYGINDLKFEFTASDGQSDTRWGVSHGSLSNYLAKPEPYTIKEFNVYLSPFPTPMGLIMGDQNDDYPITKLTNQLGKKYGLDFGYTERDKELFNLGEYDALVISFAEGQLMMTIYKEDEYQIGWYLTYTDPISGREVMESLRPNNSKSSDF